VWHSQVSIMHDAARKDIAPHVHMLSIAPLCAGEEVAETVRRRVREETGVTCSVGIAPNRMLAKVLCVMLQALHA